MEVGEKVPGYEGSRDREGTDGHAISRKLGAWYAGKGNKDIDRRGVHEGGRETKDSLCP